MEHDATVREEIALLRAAADDPAAFARFHRPRCRPTSAPPSARASPTTWAATACAERGVPAAHGAERGAVR